MEAIKLGTREKALKWWNNLCSVTQQIYADHNFNGDRWASSLTGREIEIIWDKENN